MNPELVALLAPSHAPCRHLGGLGACSSMRFQPALGHVPRGFCGATGRLDDVEVVFMCAEPGDPHPGESHHTVESTIQHTVHCLRDGRDLFHRNLRQIMAACLGTNDLDEQLRRSVVVDSVLCSAHVEGGAVPRSAELACAQTYIRPLLARIPHATVVALGGKAQSRMRRAGVMFWSAASPAPPGCNQRGSRRSWDDLAAAIRSRSRVTPQAPSRND